MRCQLGQMRRRPYKQGMISRDMSRSIIVNNNEVASIAYSGPWFTSVSGSQSSPLSSNTVHQINSSGSFSYTFRGSRILVAGHGLSSQAEWNCTVDGQSIKVPVPPLTLCLSDSLEPNSPHTMTFSVGPLSAHPFYFDYIEYWPSQAVAFHNATVFINSNDSAIQYSEGWMQPSSGTRSTMARNSNVTFMFEGVYLAWLSPPGINNLTSTSAIAQYSIDNQKPIMFDFASIDSSPRISFETPLLPRGRHSLTVTYQNLAGTPEKPSIPLSLYGFIVQNTTAPSQTASTSYFTQTVSHVSSEVFQATGSTIASLQPVAASSSNGHKFNPIVGGVIGGLISFVVMVLLLAVLFFYRRQRRNEKAKKAMEMLRASESLMPASKSEMLDSDAATTDSTYTTNRPPSPSPSDQSSSASPLSYTSRSEYHSKPQKAVSGYWDAISLGRQTIRGTSMVTSPGGATFADNGLLKRPEEPSPVEETIKTVRGAGLPTSPAVYREAHRRALQQLLGIGTGSRNAPPEVPPLPPFPDILRPGSRDEPGQHHQVGVQLKAGKSVAFGETKEEDRLN